MKVGIVTFHRAYNYGAVLQAYALSHKLNDLGLSCDVIDYYCRKFEKDYRKVSPIKARNLREFISAIVNGAVRNKKRSTFVDFVECEIPLSINKYSDRNIVESNAVYDTFITGSDQVWNLDLTDGDWHFFLDFVKPEKKRFSYAASIVSIHDDKFKEERIKKCLASFSRLTLREKSGIEYLATLGFHQTDLVIDPTLLLTQQEWKMLGNKYPVNKLLPEKYLLAYFVSPTQINLEQVKSVSEETGLPVVMINYTHRKADGVINLTTVSPGQFVNLFMNATMVLTNSFHGTAFSIDFNKEFLYILNTEKPEKNERINTIVGLLGLAWRDFRYADIDKAIDWIEINRKLDELRKRSIEILRKELID